MSACLLWALLTELCFYTVERSPPEHRAMIKGPPCGGLTATKRTSASHHPKSFLLYTPIDLRPIIWGESCGGRMESWPICGSFFPPDFGRWPTGPRQMFGRRPVGRRWMHKWPQTSAGHPANFNCELNLPDDRRTSAGWVLYRRITAGFLPDLMQKSPRANLTMDLAILGRRF